PSGAASQEVDQPPCCGIRDIAEMPPGAILAQLSPNSHMAITRDRRQRVSALQRVGECLLDQSDWHHEAMLATAQWEHADYLEQIRLLWEEEWASMAATCDNACNI
ncbi:UNVERIFIED_CONTAM: hypothetical protein K2H54_047720, partial [Gekko kuhli]